VYWIDRIDDVIDDFLWYDEFVSLWCYVGMSYLCGVLGGRTCVS